MDLCGKYFEQAFLISLNDGYPVVSKTILQNEPFLASSVEFSFPSTRAHPLLDVRQSCFSTSGILLVRTVHSLGCFSVLDCFVGFGLLASCGLSVSLELSVVFWIIFQL